MGDPFDALGDPTRREILRLLSEGDKPVHEIASALPISRPAVSRHLRLLKDAGLVDERREGNRRIYHLQGGERGAVQDYLEGVWGAGRGAFPDWWPRTRPRPRSHDRPAPHQLRRRLPTGPRVHGLDVEDRDLVAPRPHGQR